MSHARLGLSQSHVRSHVMCLDSRKHVMSHVSK